MRLFLALLAAALSGCAEYSSMPLSPEESASSFEARSFDAPGLKAFIESNLRREVAPWPPKTWDFSMLTLAAFYFHPDLDVARAKWAVVEAGVLTAGAVPNPSLQVTPEFNANAAGGVSPWIFGFSFDLPIETAGKRGYRVDQARHLSTAARLNIATAAWQVRSRLRQAVLDLAAAARTESLLQKQQELQDDIVKGVEQRLARGDVSQPDVTQAHIARDQIRLALRQARQQKAEARAQLADAIGLRSTALDAVEISVPILDMIPASGDVAPADARRRALLGRSDILAALAEYAAFEAALQLEIAKQYPDVHIGPGYSFDQGDSKWSVGLSISLPLFNRNEGPIAEAEAQRAHAAAQFNALQARISGDIDRASAVYRAAFDRLATAQELLASRRKQLQSTQALFDAGAADRLALLGARLEVETFELSHLESIVNLMQSLRLLEDALQRPLDSLGPLPPIPEEKPK